MANQVFETVQTLMAVRQYDDRPIPAAVLRRIVEAAYLSASASNIQPWHFVLVEKREDLRKLGALVRTGPYIANAAAAVIVAYEKSAAKWGVSDASRAIQDMAIVAWSEGVGSNWAGGGGLEGVRTEFGIPEAYDVLAVVSLGYPKFRVIGRKKRRPFDQVVSKERFGTPLT